MKNARALAAMKWWINKDLRVFLSAWLLLPILLSGCGPSIVEILMECPSPDGKLVAVFWWQGGGGAAGWASHYLTIHAAGVPASSAPSRGGLDAYVLEMAHGYDVRITWKDGKVLEVEYPSSARIDEAIHKYPRIGDPPQAVIRYRTVEGTDNNELPGGSSCTSGGRVIDVPAPKRLVGDP
jgi:hypothetical protein